MNKESTISAMKVLVFSCLLLVSPFSSWADTYSYDPAGRLTGVTYADGSSISYVYDANGNRLSRTASATPIVITSDIGILPNNDTVQVDLPLGTDFNTTVTTGTVANGPAGIVTGLGKISFSLNVPGPGDSATVKLTFSSALPDNLVIYKVDNANNFTSLPSSLWTQTGPSTLEITLTDGGAFDLDGAANSVIVDPIAFGSIAPSAPSSGGGGGLSLSPLLPLIMILGCLIGRRINTLYRLLS